MSSLLRKVPVKDKGVLFEKEDDREFILFNPSNGRLSVVDPIGFDIWKLCNGKHTIAGIIHKLYLVYRVSKNALQDDVISFVEELQQRGFVQILNGGCHD